MKVYISADIEGTAGIAHWDEAEIGKPGYDKFAELMTGEVAAACEGALAAGASEIVVKDAHWTARNIIADRLPEQVRLIRGWSTHPYGMIQDLDDSFDALIMTGYHSGAGTGGNPLAHTINGFSHEIFLNGDLTSEFVLNRYAAATLGVPTIFLSGDKALCDTAHALDTKIQTVATMEGIGGSANSLHPRRACEMIRDGVENALGNPKGWQVAGLPEEFHMVMNVIKHKECYAAQFYPGVEMTGPHRLEFRANAFSDVMCMLHFVLKG